jgi:hypothetical protein
MAYLLMIADDLDVVSIPAFPAEAQPPLIVDTDAVLACAISREPLKPVAGRDAQIPERLRCIENGELSLSIRCTS